MPDEKDETTEDLDEQEAVEEDLPEELPDDPAELKAVAERAIALVKSAKQTVTQLQSEQSGLKENLEEERTGRKLWYSKWEELDKSVKKGNGKAEEAADPDEDVYLHDLVARDTKFSDLKRSILKDAEQIAERVASRKAAQLTQQGSHARQIVGEYPDLNEADSPLQKAVVQEMATVSEEFADLKDKPNFDQIVFETAVRRSAARLGVLPNKGEKPKADDPERARRRAGQGGPTGKTSQKSAVVITDADRAEMRRMNGGQEVPDEYIKRAKTIEIERREQRQRARA